jgi:predicted alpha/beta hydrolase
MDAFLEIALDQALSPSFRCRDVTVDAGDCMLAGTVHEPSAGGDGARVVVIASATGVPRGYYDPFARFLATRGSTVLSFDYRGIGGSRPGRLRGYRARMEDWGRRDLSAAISYAHEALGAERPVLVGHSVGGQLAPLAPNADRLGALLLVGSQSGDYRLWPAHLRLPLAAMWWGVVPALAGTWGYLPGWSFGGESLPRGVALEWASWARRPGYLVGGGDGGRRRAFERITAPVRLLSFSDDALAPKAAVASLGALYGGAARDHRHVTPADVGRRAIGHFGFFRERVGRPLWPEAAAWLESAGSRAAAA